MTIPSVRFVVFRYDHHSPHSGYSKLATHALAQINGEVIKVGKPLSRTIVRERILRRLARGTPGYDRSALATELKVGWQMVRESGYIYHFLYGETTYHYAGILNNIRKNRVIATFHQPPSRIQNAVQIDWHLRQLSAVICVGRNQQEFFADIIDREKIFFVPLGVDTNFFTPPTSFETRDPNLCLFVGVNYRDFPTLRGVVELVTHQRPNTNFVAVTQTDNFEKIGFHPNLTMRSDIQESELRELYQSASLMVMPLKDATANNAVLESLACGLPMVVSDVGAIRDYVDPECAILTPVNDARVMAKAVVDLLDNPLQLQVLSKRSRKKALSFSWKEIVRQLNAIYSEIA